MTNKSNERKEVEQIKIEDSEDIYTIAEWVGFLFNGDIDDINYIRENEHEDFLKIKEKYQWKYVGYNAFEVLKQILGGEFNGRNKTK